MTRSYKRSNHWYSDLTGSFKGYMVAGIRFISPSTGAIGWQISCWHDEQGRTEIFWVIDSEFYEFATHPLPSRLLHFPVEIVDLSVIVDRPVCEAVLEALDEGEKKVSHKKL